MSSLRDAVRDKLREDKVKLWLPPYDDASKVDALAKQSRSSRAPDPPRPLRRFWSLVMVFVLFLQTIFFPRSAKAVRKHVVKRVRLFMTLADRRC